LDIRAKGCLVLEVKPPAKSDAFDRSLQHHLVEVLLLRMVFMSEGKQSRLSPAQKADVWSRWKALGVPTASPSAVCKAKLPGQQPDHLCNRPNVICQSSFHCRGDAGVVGQSAPEKIGEIVGMESIGGRVRRDKRISQARRHNGNYRCRSLCSIYMAMENPIVF
jgi:hypothetical protein